MGKKLEIKVAFDTNGLYTKVAHDLLNKSIADLIKKESSRTDINLTWHCPKVVIQERQYQMQKAANELLPSMERIEILLGHKLNITSDILAKRVEEAISKQIKEYKIDILELDHSKVDLESIIEKSCFRHLPFSQGKEEKGFRDAIIAESFFQLVDKSPKSPTICKIVFFTNDGELKQHIVQHLENNKNIVVLSSVEEIEGLINTLASDIDEITIRTYQDTAANYFFNAGNKEGKYFSEKIRDKIEYEYRQVLGKCPDGRDLKRQNKTWFISPPQFIKKDRARLSWLSRVEVSFEIYTTVPSNSGLFDNYYTSNKIDLMSNNIFSTHDKLLHLGKPLGLLSNEVDEKKVISKGKTIFDIRWGANLSTKNKFTRFNINEIKYIETTFDG